MSNLLNEFAESAELYEAVEKIGTKLGLHIDQMGELDAEIRDILMGISKSSEFSKHIKERLEVDDSKAREIMNEVNTQIFDALKKRMQEEESKSVENAGQFSLERERETPDNLPIGDQAAILSQIEDPKPSLEKFVEKKLQETPHTEPLVDQLLSKPVSNPETKSKVEAPKNDAAGPETPKPKDKPTGPDPYREPIK